MTTENFYADIREVVRSCMKAWAPPPKLTMSEWADSEFYLSAVSAAQAGKWKCLPYQKGILDTISDPTVTQVSVMKSARVGFSKMLNIVIGYYVQHDPCSILMVQPTILDAQNYAKEEIVPMFRDCPSLEKIIFSDSKQEGEKGPSQTILSKEYPGGVLSLVGSNSGAGFRRISRRVILMDEIDGYSVSAGEEGDPVKLAIRRSEYFWNRKIIGGSTPLIAGHSRIESLFESGDQRRYYVPCPHCGHMDYLVFTQRDSGGHYMVFDTQNPKDAHFVCSVNGCVIEHSHKRGMIEKGEWRASKPFDGHASFHIWAAYSYSPNATWGDIATEFIESKRGGRDTLKTFINTVLGETWKESGEAPDWERLYSRREHYPIGSVPDGVKFLTCGIDVQKDRWVYVISGWSYNKESWIIDYGVIPGDTSNEKAWVALDELLQRQYPSHVGTQTIKMLAVDSGYNTNLVYSWVRRHERNRVVAVKGVSTARTLIGSPTPVDINLNGQRISRGAKVWPIGVDIAKSELYGWLKLPIPLDGEKPPPGYVHFPELGDDFFKQLTSEHLVSTKQKTGYAKHEWQLIPGRENHALDARNYSRAAAAICGLDRMAPAKEDANPPVSGVNPPVLQPIATPKPAMISPVVRKTTGWLKRR